jgi:hypothetical protein
MDGNYLVFAPYSVGTLRNGGFSLLFFLAARL